MSTAAGVWSMGCVRITTTFDSGAMSVGAKCMFLIHLKPEVYVSYTLENLIPLLIMYNREPLWGMAFHKQEEEAFWGGMLLCVYL